MEDIKINLTLKQIHDVLCPECQEKLINLASTEGAKDFAVKQIKDQVEKQMKS